MFLLFIFHNYALDSYTDDITWQNKFEELCQYKADHGNCLVPSSYRDNLGLGHWVTSQRQLKTKQSPRLTKRQIALMDSVGFVWSLRKSAKTVWEKRFNFLCEYRHIYGHCMVPQRYNLNPQLGNWVSLTAYSFGLS